MTPRYKWELLLLLWLAYFFNQADRQIFSVVLPLIKKDLLLSDAQLGLIASVLVWTYGLLVPVAGFVGNRYPKKYVIASSLLFWSVATVLTGLCSTLIQFVLLRGIATGGGEAFYAPSANSLISHHHDRTRSRALAIHQTAVYAGIILSGLLAGYIAQKYGWRNAFYIFGAFGICLSFIIGKRFIKDVPSVGAQQPFALKKTLQTVGRKPTFILLSIGFACMVFVNVGYLTWMPAYLTEKFSLTLADAGFSSMFYHHIGAFFGVIAGGFIADKLATKYPVSRLVVQAVGLLFGAPFIYLLGRMDSQAGIYSCLFAFGFFRGIYDSNIYASLFEIVPPAIRSSASGIMLMFAFLTGAFSPYILGVLKPKIGMAAGLSGLWIMYVLGALVITIAARFYFKKDKEYTLS